MCVCYYVGGRGGGGLGGNPPPIGIGGGGLKYFVLDVYTCMFVHKKSVETSK